jgi:hypothetical protein
VDSKIINGKPSSQYMCLSQTEIYFGMFRHLSSQGACWRYIELQLDVQHASEDDEFQNRYCILITTCDANINKYAIYEKYISSFHDIYLVILLVKHLA